MRALLRAVVELPARTTETDYGTRQGGAWDEPIQAAWSGD